LVALARNSSWALGAAALVLLVPGWCTLFCWPESTQESIRQGRKNADYWAIFKCRLRRSTLPYCVAWINTYPIPNYQDRSCSPMAFDSSRLRSQYCCTRRSATRVIVAVEDENKSVGRTGSHTTNTRRCSPRCRSIRRSTAEAPCRQIVHVGESSVNYAHLSVRLVKIPPKLLEISRGERKERLLPCRGGTAAIKMVEQAGQDKDHCERNEQPTTFHNSPARRPAIACGKNTEVPTMTADTQSRTMLTLLGRQLHCLARWPW